MRRGLPVFDPSLPSGLPDVEKPGKPPYQTVRTGRADIENPDPPRKRPPSKPREHKAKR